MNGFEAVYEGQRDLEAPLIHSNWTPKQNTCVCNQSKHKGISDHGKTRDFSLRLWGPVIGDSVVGIV